jgi:alkylhydroperoxidase/carboxymuconolactone decarboxylase family protein YurZ
MDQDKKFNAKDIASLNPRQRELIIAYLSYALDDVRALGGIGSQLLQMTIAAIAEDSVADDSSRALQSTLAH